MTLVLNPTVVCKWFLEESLAPAARLSSGLTAHLGGTGSKVWSPPERFQQ